MPVGIGPVELVVVLVIVPVVFGAGTLGTVGGAIGRGTREFRQAQGGDDAADRRHWDGDRGGADAVAGAAGAGGLPRGPALKRGDPPRKRGARAGGGRGSRRVP